MQYFDQTLPVPRTEVEKIRINQWRDAQAQGRKLHASLERVAFHQHLTIPGLQTGQWYPLLLTELDLVELIVEGKTYILSYLYITRFFKVEVR
ncbi:hypothetical protein LUCX_194 [Xanthomonas phage vB_XciM_LucasX]|nr:hypothetical protein LUCX_194 [Xanthomonas phage vB_XciM_LucasX]